MSNPAQHLIDHAIDASLSSTCRSKRGCVIFDQDDNQLALGFNYRPWPPCDGSLECKKTCRRTAIHAEQFALLYIGTNARGKEMLHVKTVDGALVPSGGPSCVECSKLALVAGIRAIWLYHPDGWKRYETKDWHRLSLEANNLL